MGNMSRSTFVAVKQIKSNQNWTLITDFDNGEHYLETTRNYATHHVTLQDGSFGRSAVNSISTWQKLNLSHTIFVGTNQGKILPVPGPEYRWLSARMQ